MRRLRLCQTLAESRSVVRASQTPFHCTISSPPLRRRLFSSTELSPKKPDGPPIAELDPPHLSSTTRTESIGTSLFPNTPKLTELESLPSPDPAAYLKSAKLAALHARLYLPPAFPLQTLGRCLVDQSADPDPRFNNTALAAIGSTQLGALVTEHLVCKYPRIPTSVLFMAQDAYIGPRSMNDMARGWGVESVVSPGGEVDPGLLQFKRRLRNEPVYEEGYHMRQRRQEKQEMLPTQLRDQQPGNEFAILTSGARVMSGDQFGNPPPKGKQAATLETASSNFVFAFVGALYLHLGRPAVKNFLDKHVLSRNLDISRLFKFKVPNRDLLLLCRREGFEAPVPRMISETGRLSSHPVFVVGVYSGLDKLGEGAGGSVKEAKVRATVAALKGWYLYSPVEFTKPSDFESETGKTWTPNLVDCGEIIA